MTASEIQELITSLENLRNAYEAYRSIQEQEHSHLSRRCSIAEWNVLIRQKQLALQNARTIAHESAALRQRWQDMGKARIRPEFSSVREKLSQVQTLLTRILTCDRMNETLLYNGGYLQSVVAYRSVSMTKEL